MHRVAEVSGLSQPGLDRLRAQVPSIFLGPFSSCCVLLSLVQQLFPPCAGLREIGAPKVMCCGGWEEEGVGEEESLQTLRNRLPSTSVKEENLGLRETSLTLSVEEKLKNKSQIRMSIIRLRHVIEIDV